MHIILVSILIIIVAVSNATHSFGSPSKNLQRFTKSAQVKNVSIDLCPLCINEAVEAINVILNVILDEGIMENCEKLCDIVANKTSSGFIGTVCNLACDAVGLDEFVHLIIKVDLDPIWYCEMARLCPSKQKKVILTKEILYQNICF